MKEKYRIKTEAKDGLHGVVKKVQARKWYGWVTVKEFPKFDYLDGTVDAGKADARHYIDVCAEELLEHLNEDI